MVMKVVQASGETIPVEADKPLSSREERFCREYVIDRNGGKAYRRAGFKPNSDASAWARASLLLRNVKVRERIAELEEDLARDAKMRAQEVYEEIALLSCSSVGNYRIDANGELKVRRGIDPKALRAVASIETTVKDLPGGRKEVKTTFRLWNKPAALRMADEALGIFKDQAIPFQNSGILVVEGFDPDLALGRRLVNQENAARAVED
jgi:phage terminase small subunit